jgi:hypothetical protein
MRRRNSHHRGLSKAFNNPPPAVLAKAPADLLTRYPREAGADLLNKFQESRHPFHSLVPAFTPLHAR